MPQASQAPPEGTGPTWTSGANPPLPGNGPGAAGGASTGTRGGSPAGPATRGGRALPRHSSLRSSLEVVSL
eukprot:12487864-Alexandrium_andersonii.AAC.1